MSLQQKIYSFQAGSHGGTSRIQPLSNSLNHALITILSRYHGNHSYITADTIQCFFVSRCINFEQGVVPANKADACYHCFSLTSPSLSVPVPPQPKRPQAWLIIERLWIVIGGYYVIMAG